MYIRTSGFAGWIVGIIILLLIISLFRFAGWIVFGTPIGLVLVGYFGYKYIKGRKQVADVTQDYYEASNNQHGQDSVIDVDFEEIDSDE